MFIEQNLKRNGTQLPFDHGLFASTSWRYSSRELVGVSVFISLEICPKHVNIVILPTRCSLFVMFSSFDRLVSDWLAISFSEDCGY